MEEELELFSNATVTVIPTTDMNTTTGTIRGLHPGVTTIISFSVAIILVLTYLYCDNFLNCLGRICRCWVVYTKQPSEGATHPARVAPTNSTGTDVTDVVERGPSRDNFSRTIWDGKRNEAAILCKCGQIHKLSDAKTFQKQYQSHEYTNTDTKIIPKYVASSSGAVTLQNPSVNFNRSEVPYDSFSELTENSVRAWSKSSAHDEKTLLSLRDHTTGADKAKVITVPNIMIGEIKPGVS